MEQFLRSSHFSGGNAAYIEELYETYLHEPNSVPEEWSSFFDSLAAHQWISYSRYFPRHHYSAL